MTQEQREELLWRVEQSRPLIQDQRGINVIQNGDWLHVGVHAEYLTHEEFDQISKIIFSTEKTLRKTS